VRQGSSTLLSYGKFFSSFLSPPHAMSNFSPCSILKFKLTAFRFQVGIRHKAYDQIHHNLSPFWGIEPMRLQAIQYDWAFAHARKVHQFQAILYCKRLTMSIGGGDYSARVSDTAFDESSDRCA